MNAGIGYGFTGRTLRINLTSGEIKAVDYSSQYKEWPGGSTLAVKILYDELQDWVTPYDPRNRLIISAGALLGTLAPGACKMNISTLSPVTGGWATGSSDSYVGLELKHAGYDQLIIEGRSHFPCYIWINNDKVEIRDASKLWGKTTWETLDLIQEELDDPSLHTVSIGPAGENLVRGACVIQDRERAFGRCGTGAVMGSKNLKALVCKGTRPIEMADPERFMKKVSELRERIAAGQATPGFAAYGTLGCFEKKQEICAIPFKNFQHCRMSDEVAKVMSPKTLIEKYQTHREGFPGCPIVCGRYMSITDGKYKGLKTAMHQWELLGGLSIKLGCEENPAFGLVANDLCNKLGVDLDAAGGAIAWAMECFERRIIDEKDTDGIVLKWGDEETILELIRKLSYREGFGNILAEGSARAAEIIGRDSGYYAMHVKKQDLYELMRSSNGWCLGTAVSTRGGGHTTGAPGCEQFATPMDNELTQKILGMTNTQAQSPAEYDYKAKLVDYFEVLTRLCNSFGVCIFNSVWTDISFINVDDMAELISAATGIEFTVEDLKRITTRQLNLEKALNLRHTDFSRKDDFPPEREMEEPISSGSRKGFKLDREQYNRMLDEYYELKGWERATSYPTRATLESYDLAYVADDLEKIGKLGQATN